MLFAVTLRCILKVLRLQCLKEKILGPFSRFMRPNTKLFAVKLTRCGSTPLAFFTRKIMGTFSWFMRPKTKLFAVRWRRTLEALRLQGLQKKFWARFHDLCIRKRSCLLWCLYAFGTFSPCKVYETCSGRIFTISCVHKSLLCCSGPLRSPWLCILLKCLESGHILSTSAPINCDVQA